MDKEKIADDLQTHSSSLTAINETLRQTTVLLKKADDQQRNYFLNWVLPKALDTIGIIANRLDEISADLKEG
ncbi:hypothetical protein [Ligilactobacillus saerimneri]|uniref:hypothetical protein n=1 Tax=Ligilactobacillus saerimneri TaxID=228229 RepID=UPI00041A9CBC|nr:hypothetical protein [Ligilactobacillus saerimneri]KRL73303.1 hypothetical protein FC54_GL000739 [Ligilactobacillus saerimneri DSM 16049]